MRHRWCVHCGRLSRCRECEECFGRRLERIVAEIEEGPRIVVGPDPRPYTRDEVRTAEWVAWGLSVVTVGLVVGLIVWGLMG